MDVDNLRSLPSCRSLMPVVKRARDYHIYDCSGRRYLDLYLNGGRCMLGHRPEGVFGVLKNTLSRGPAAEYPSVEQRGYMRHLKAFFPEFQEFRVYSSIERALSAAGSVIGEPSVTVDDPLTTDRPGPVQLWRPFAPVQTQKPEVILPLIPFPSGTAPITLCFRGSSPAESEDAPPYFLAALSRALSGLKRFAKLYGEELWQAFDLPGLWERKGPYLVFRLPEGEYVNLFTLMLQKGILLPPELPAVGIVPGSFTAGEIAPIIKAAKDWGV